MVFIKLREGEGLEEALRRFKRECERNGVLKEVKRREHYMSPAIKRKRRPRRLDARCVAPSGVASPKKATLAGAAHSWAAPAFRFSP